MLPNKTDRRKPFLKNSFTCSHQFDNKSCSFQYLKRISNSVSHVEDKKKYIFCFYFLIDSREREEGREKNRERNNDGLLLAFAPNGDQTHNPSLCPDWELSPRPRMMPNQQTQTSQEKDMESF